LAHFFRSSSIRNSLCLQDFRNLKCCHLLNKMKKFIAIFFPFRVDCSRKHTHTLSLSLSLSLSLTHKHTHIKAIEYGNKMGIFYNRGWEQHTNKQAARCKRKVALKTQILNRPRTKSLLKVFFHLFMKKNWSICTQKSFSQERSFRYKFT